MFMQYNMIEQTHLLLIIPFLMTSGIAQNKHRHICHLQLDRLARDINFTQSIDLDIKMVQQTVSYSIDSIMIFCLDFHTISNVLLLIYYLQIVSFAWGISQNLLQLIFHVKWHLVFSMAFYLLYMINVDSTAEHIRKLIRLVIH